MVLSVYYVEFIAFNEIEMRSFEYRKRKNGNGYGVDVAEKEFESPSLG